MRQVSGKVLICFVFLVTFSFVSLPQAGATIYTGWLTGDGGGIIATDPWNSSLARLDWEVESVGVLNGFVLWEYEYTFTIPTSATGQAKNISHLIVELSEGTTQEEIINMGSDIAPGTAGADIGLVGAYSSANGNPGMPSGFTGIKFGPGGAQLAFSFQTVRAPVWGDFYAKDGVYNGNKVTAWNAGFSTADPAVAPHDGSEQGHILRPDTKQIGIPEPATWLLLGAGLAGVGLVRRKMRKS